MFCSVRAACMYIFLGGYPHPRAGSACSSGRQCSRSLNLFSPPRQHGNTWPSRMISLWIWETAVETDGTWSIRRELVGTLPTNQLQRSILCFWSVAASRAQTSVKANLDLRRINWPDIGLIAI